ncbi:MAG: hypothetical protein NWS46_05610 [Cyclobacteriaceae bacterium]|jgi:hypothetical protein|nr:hypothetical protein [Cyclobacteriaceae bacterium]
MRTFGSYHKDRNAYIFAGEPLTIHTDFYNCFLQKAVEDISQYIDVRPILINSAQEIAYTQFTILFKGERNWGIEKRKKAVEDYYSFCGYGKINVPNLQAKGGFIELKSEHYSMA